MTSGLGVIFKEYPPQVPENPCAARTEKNFSLRDIEQSHGVNWWCSLAVSSVHRKSSQSFIHIFVLFFDTCKCLYKGREESVISTVYSKGMKSHLTSCQSSVTSQLCLFVWIIMQISVTCFIGLCRACWCVKLGNFMNSSSLWCCRMYFIWDSKEISVVCSS